MYIKFEKHTPKVKFANSGNDFVIPTHSEDRKGTKRSNIVTVTPKKTRQTHKGGKGKGGHWSAKISSSTTDVVASE